jgi:hypothetical protein
LTAFSEDDLKGLFVVRGIFLLFGKKENKKYKKGIWNGKKVLEKSQMQIGDKKSSSWICAIYFWTTSGVKFTNVLRTSFTLVDPKSVKRH